MTVTGQSFWPENIDVGVLSPKEILETQANALADITKGLVTAKIIETTVATDKAPTFQLQLILVATNLTYERQILTISHGIQLFYPATVDADCFRTRPPPLMRELIKDATGMEWPTDAPTAVTDRDLGTLVKTVLRSDEVRSLLTSLIARSKDLLRSQGRAVPQK
jgi:hypothetical protein